MERVPLSDCVDSLLDNWVEDYREEAENGSVDAMLIYS